MAPMNSPRRCMDTLYIPKSLMKHETENQKRDKVPILSHKNRMASCVMLTREGPQQKDCAFGALTLYPPTPNPK